MPAPGAGDNPVCLEVHQPRCAWKCTRPSEKTTATCSSVPITALSPLHSGGKFWNAQPGQHLPHRCPPGFFTLAAQCPLRPSGLLCGGCSSSAGAQGGQGPSGKGQVWGADGPSSVLGGCCASLEADGGCSLSLPALACHPQPLASVSHDHILTQLSSL